jgi:hypothetical protein
MWLKESQLEPVKVTVEQLPKDGFLRRFAEISCMLLERASPFSVTSVHSALARQAFELGLSPICYSQRPYISDHLSAQVDGAWLKRHVPDWTAKRPLKYFHRIDSVVDVKKSPAAAEAYVMAMAALYETPAEAMQYVSLAEALFKVHSRSRSPLYWMQEISEKDDDCHNLIKPIVERLQLDIFYVYEILGHIGLPNMRAYEPSDAWAVLIRFLAGDSIAVACSAEQVDRQKVRDLLRNCSGNVISTIKAVRRVFHLRSPRSRKVGGRRRPTRTSSKRRGEADASAGDADGFRRS